MRQEMDGGKLRIVWGVGCGFITQVPHGAITWGNPATDVGSQRGWGRIYHICGVLSRYSELGGVPISGPGNFQQLR